MCNQCLKTIDDEIETVDSSYVEEDERDPYEHWAGDDMMGSSG